MLLAAMQRSSWQHCRCSSERSHRRPHVMRLRPHPLIIAAVRQGIQKPGADAAQAEPRRQFVFLHQAPWVIVPDLTNGCDRIQQLKKALMQDPVHEQHISQQCKEDEGSSN